MRRRSNALKALQRVTPLTFLNRRSWRRWCSSFRADGDASAKTTYLRIVAISGTGQRAALGRRRGCAERRRALQPRSRRPTLGLKRAVKGQRATAGATALKQLHRAQFHQPVGNVGYFGRRHLGDKIVGGERLTGPKLQSTKNIEYVVSFPGRVCHFDLIPHLHFCPTVVRLPLSF